MLFRSAKNKNIGTAVSENRNSFLVLLLFSSIILFQMTGLKYIWALESISFLSNMLVLGLLFFICVYSFLNHRFSLNVWLKYQIPAFLIFFGFLLNILISSISDYKILTQMGNALPWLFFMAVPHFLKRKEINVRQLWKYFFYFIVLINLLGLLEYYSILLGNATFRILPTPYGTYLANKFSILYLQEDGLPHHRYYSCFLEPGTLAMFLLPAIAYAFFYKKFLSLIILLIAFYFTYSLGGLISLVLLAVIFIFLIFYRNKKYLIISGIITIFFAIGLWINFREAFYEEYEQKDNAAAVREESLTKTFTKLPFMLANYPFGMKLGAETNDLEKNKDYIKANFIVTYYINTGGVFSFLGYVTILILSVAVAIKGLLKGNIPVEDKLVFSSILVLFPFIFQRSTVWESGIFALMFAPTILKYLDAKKNAVKG